ncbi:MAG: hypothetical protein ACI89E_001031, partial [Planctomycetota bacterium]
MFSLRADSYPGPSPPPNSYRPPKRLPAHPAKIWHLSQNLTPIMMLSLLAIAAL